MLVVKVGRKIATEIVCLFKDEEYQKAIEEFKSQTTLCTLVGQAPWVVEFGYVDNDGKYVTFDRKCGFMTLKGSNI